MDEAASLDDAQNLILPIVGARVDATEDAGFADLGPRAIKSAVGSPAIEMNGNPTRRQQLLRERVNSHELDAVRDVRSHPLHLRRQNRRKPVPDRASTPRAEAATGLSGSVLSVPSQWLRVHALISRR